ncbi:MAG: hypothetical protein SV583_02075 [Pseudomonadota bacterium]|jgi:hypothetical protein|nr:hypothetical protein [Pseudomonadota bacterium]
MQTRWKESWAQKVLQLMCVLCAFGALQAQAAVDLGDLSAGDDVVEFATADSGVAFSETFEFTLLEAGTVFSTAIAYGVVDSFSASLDGVDMLPFTSNILLGLPVTLAPGDYSLMVSGTLTSAFSLLTDVPYAVELSVAAVPLPAPVLLLGSAILGLVGFSRRGASAEA